MVYYTSNIPGITNTFSLISTVEDQENTLYTCPLNCKSHVSLLFINNSGSGTVDISIKLQRSDATNINILSGKNFSSAEFLQFSDAFIVLQAGDSLKITPSSQASPVVHSLCTVEEFFITTTGVG